MMREHQKEIGLGGHTRPPGPMPSLQNLLESCLWHVLLIGVVTLLIFGCSLTVPSDGPGQSNGTDTASVDSKSHPAEIWAALGQAAKAKTIGTTTRLAQYVVVLARNGELTEQDVTAFDAAFPKIAAGQRELTDVDVNTLIDLGRKAKQ